MSERILITGGCGFVGHHMVEHILKNTDKDIVVLDKLGYASNGYDKLRDISAFDDKRINIFATDFSHPIEIGIKKEIGNVDYILHLGGETHVDNSIINPESFVMSNVVGTMRMLDYAKGLSGLRWFLFFSTDEVFGPAPNGILYKEWDRYDSGNPYSATKAGAEELCLAYANTFKLPVIITHTMNVFGERQHKEKFIPSTIKKVLHDELVIIHADPTRTISGSRFYIHARNVASAVLWLLENAAFREKYNIVGEKEVSNLDLAQTIANFLGKNLRYEMVDFHSSRAGHDLRYALDGTKMRELGWSISKGFDLSLEKTIQWYLNNLDWLDK